MTNLISDEEGQFWGIAGHHSARTLLRAVMGETGMSVRDITEGYWQGWSSMVKQGWWTVMRRSDPYTWGKAERLALYEDGDDWRWPHEWDDVYTPCGESEKWAVAATFWQP